MTDVDHLVIVGASVAGLRAVEGARKTGYAGRISLIGAEEHLPYDRPPLSKTYLTDEQPQPTFYRTEEAMREQLGVDLFLGQPATGLDVAEQVVHTGATEHRYDALVIATGSTARTMPEVGTLGGVLTLRTLDDARVLRAGLDRATRLVVVGGGFIGSEIASAGRARGLPVTIVEALPTPLVRAIGEQMGAACAALHQRNGTQLMCGVPVDRLEGDGHVERVILSDGAVLEADLVVVGTGADPATGWLGDSGLRLDNGIVCDETLWTGAPGVYAAGDVARWVNPTFDRLMRLEHWTSAGDQGRHAGQSAVDPQARKPFSGAPYFWSDWYDANIRFIGIPSDEVQVVIGSTDDGSFLSLYREGDTVVGAFAINQPRHLMKFRPLIAGRASWAEALEFGRERASA
ncbi:NAD/ferredoxin-dependent reductase-like protein [Antricoccus suffuscus]|uniref:NAD/ferredoxin-dependent reductase-like protein n=1 Tax=Antricoccus suffuscus TaxID=1629062 RepID=A0A2T1A2N2_9ACTN|nr:FAD-dependent oxidoreductase [Antricoccus suffuscus]PRZ42846.1 NAD/ferredoxin-dependent reductase-like protein [Antricoccus suffuscus]